MIGGEKMKKNIIKIINILIILMAIVTMLSTTVNATLDPSKITASTTTDTAAITKVGNQVVGILTTVGVVLSVVILIVIGIKYMMGSAEEKAEYKKTMMPYIIGAALIFAASAIATVVYNYMTGISTT